jgi:glycosyltransferase involved in cell wall biosynthesis
MRVLLANSTAYPEIGGVENSLRFMGRELVQAGHEAKIFCLQSSSDEPLYMQFEGIEILRYPCKAVRWPPMQQIDRVNAVQRAIPEVVDDFQPDAIWCRSTSVGVGIRKGGYTGPLLQIFPTNAEMHCRGSFLKTQGLPLQRRVMLFALWPLAYYVLAYLERRLARQCELITFSENMRRQLLKGFPRGARSCHVIRPGVDTAVFSPKNGARFLKSIESEWGVNRNEPIVLYVGRLSSAKNLPMLIDAISMLRRPVKLLLVGAGSEENYLKNHAARIGLTENVVFVGTQYEKLPGFYVISRVSVLPTTIESFGQVYLESLACGTPAIGFSGDGQRVLTATNEIIQDGKTGGVVNEVSARALAKKINSILLLNNDNYVAMSHLARSYVRKHFSWSRFVARALEISSSLQVKHGN